MSKVQLSTCVRGWPMIETNLEKLKRAVIILNRRDAPIEERLARAYLFGLAWIYPDAAFIGHEREFDLLRDEVARVYYGDRAAIRTRDLVDLERRVLALSDTLTRRPQIDPSNPLTRPRSSTANGAG